MVYGRLIYNSCKDFTPSWFKTLPYQQATKPTFVRQAQVVSRFNADPKIKGLWRFLQRNVQNYPWLWQLYIFANSFILFSLAYYPWLWVYQYNNRDRTLDFAIQKEKEFQATQQEAEY